MSISDATESADNGGAASMICMARSGSDHSSISS